MAGMQSMRDVAVHLGAAADAAFSGSHNDEIHRAWFVQLAEQIMSRAVSIGFMQSFRVQCDPRGQSRCSGWNQPLSRPCLLPEARREMVLDRASSRPR